MAAAWLFNSALASRVALLAAKLGSQVRNLTDQERREIEAIRLQRYIILNGLYIHMMAGS